MLSQDKITGQIRMALIQVHCDEQVYPGFFIFMFRFVPLLVQQNEFVIRWNFENQQIKEDETYTSNKRWHQSHARIQSPMWVEHYTTRIGSY